LFDELNSWYIVPMFRKNLDLILELCFSHVAMPAKFGLHLLSISIVINHACDIMSRFVIFVLNTSSYLVMIFEPVLG